MLKKTDFLIVGGSAAGTTAADTIRNLLPDASIMIVTEEDHEQYSLVLIPHYIRGKISREQVFLKKPQWYEQKNIVLLKGVRAQRLDVGKKTVILSNNEEIEFGKLLLTVGGKVIPFNVPGADSKNLLYLRTIDDADKIIAQSKQAKRAIIIGGGFIGLEFASCFVKNGVTDITTLVLEDFYWQGKLDSESSRVIAEVLVKNGIKVETNVSVDHFEIQDGEICAAIAKDGRRFEADLVGVGVGIRSNLAWLLESGLKTDRGIVTNEYLETNLPHVYAAGDCAQFWDSVFERQHMLGNWANATSQGLTVGKTMSGEKTKFETVSSYTTNFFDPPRLASSEAGPPTPQNPGQASGSCSFLGVTDVGFADRVITRGSSQVGTVTRIFVKKIREVNRVVGATVINNPADVSPLTVAIKTKKDVSDLKAKLADSSLALTFLVS